MGDSSVADAVGEGAGFGGEETGLALVSAAGAAALAGSGAVFESSSIT